MCKAIRGGVQPSRSPSWWPRRREFPGWTKPRSRRLSKRAEVFDRAAKGETRLGHILLCEDNLVNQAVALEMIRIVGWSVDVAGTGHEALDALDKRRYDLVLMDCEMPGMDGYESDAAHPLIRSRAGETRSGATPATAGSRAHRARAPPGSYPLPRGRHGRLSDEAVHAAPAGEYPSPLASYLRARGDPTGSKRVRGELTAQSPTSPSHGSIVERRSKS